MIDREIEKQTHYNLHLQMIFLHIPNVIPCIFTQQQLFKVFLEIWMNVGLYKSMFSTAFFGKILFVQRVEGILLWKNNIERGIGGTFHEEARERYYGDTFNQPNKEDIWNWCILWKDAVNKITFSNTFKLLLFAISYFDLKAQCDFVFGILCNDHNIMVLSVGD